ncbi:unnamed protein product [Phytophthora lilii]|uniref:Unnamed protein product n=1 Tax=Phytophthora lilii TaxID=2077276 RepID=A0A9W6X589_9STRA|nr:unnamed protein product [Phytophthora lilii]
MIDDDIVGDWEIQSDNDSLAHQNGDSNLQASDSDTSYDGLELELPLSRGSADDPHPEPVHLHFTGQPIAPTSATIADNEDLASIQGGSGLHLAMEARIKQAFDKDGSYGLFALFVTGALRQSIRGWTSTRLEAGGKKPLTESELNAYLGLEIAMSICPLNDKADYWSGERFLGQPAFIETMARDRFQHIRSALQFQAPMPVTFATVRDLLYRCRGLLHHFQKRFAETAVPLGTSSLDEMSVRTKARSRARTYMPSRVSRRMLQCFSLRGCAEY